MLQRPGPTWSNSKKVSKQVVNVICKRTQSSAMAKSETQDDSTKWVGRLAGKVGGTKLSACYIITYNTCLQVEDRSPALVEHIANLIKKLLMIVSRPARLLECLVSSVTLLVLQSVVINITCHLCILNSHNLLCLAQD